jgi:hypothetical protein
VQAPRSAGRTLAGALVLPVGLALVSLVLPSYFYVDPADRTVGWGPTALVWVPSAAPSSYLALHYPVALALVALGGGLAAAARPGVSCASPPPWLLAVVRWGGQEGASRAGVLALAAAVAVVVGLSHWSPGSSEGAWRRWSCSLGPEACASGWLIWFEGDTVFWAEGSARALGHAALVVLGALCLPLGKSAGLGDAAPGSSSSSSSSGGGLGGGVDPGAARRFHAWCGSVFLALVLFHAALFARAYRYYDTWPGDLWRPYPEFAPTNGTVLCASVVALLLAASAALLPLDGRGHVGQTNESGRGDASGSSGRASSDDSSCSSSSRRRRAGFFRRVLAACGVSPSSAAQLAHRWLGTTLLLAVGVHAKGGWPFALLGLALQACDATVRTHRTARLVRVTSAALLPAQPTRQPPPTLGSSAGAPTPAVADLPPRLLRLSYTVERYRGGRGRLPPWLAKRLPAAWFSGGTGGGAGPTGSSDDSRNSNGNSNGSSTSTSSSAGRLWEPWEALRVAGPGQWVYLNCPEVSAVEWFPAFLSSAPGDEASTHHLPLSGGLSWPDRFAALAAAAESSSSSGSNKNSDDSDDRKERCEEGPNDGLCGHGGGGGGVTLNVDGPYGPARDLGSSGARRIMLVGAGAGASPAHSHFRHLYRQARHALRGSSSGGYAGGRAANDGRVVNGSPAAGATGVEEAAVDGLVEGGSSVSSASPRVHLLWVCRDGAAFASDPLFADTLRAVQGDSLGGRFSFSLYATRAGATAAGAASSARSSGSAPPFPAVAGRPDLAAILSAMGQWQQEERHRPRQPASSTRSSTSTTSSIGDRGGPPPALVYASGPPSLLRECAFHAGRCGLRLVEDPYPHLWPSRQ